MTEPTLTPEERALREAIFSAPADDAPRLVYADWLTERHEPWGHFIAAQLRGETQVAAELFATVRARAGGGLDRPGITSLGDFERGFLVKPPLPQSSQHHCRHLDAWGAVEHLLFDPERSDEFVEAVAQAGHWRALKTAVGDAHTLAALARCEPSLRLSHLQVGAYDPLAAGLFSLVGPETSLLVDGPAMGFSVSREGQKAVVTLDGVGAGGRGAERALQDVLRRVVARDHVVSLEAGQHHEALAALARHTLSAVGAKVRERRLARIR